MNTYPSKREVDKYTKADVDALKAKNRLIDTLGDKVVEILPHYDGDECVAILYEEIKTLFHRNTTKCRRILASRPSGTPVREYGGENDYRFYEHLDLLSALPGGRSTALLALVEYGRFVLDYSAMTDDFEACLTNGLRKIDNYGVQLCEAIVRDPDTTQLDFFKACEAVGKARKDGLEWFGKMSAARNGARMNNSYFRRCLWSVEDEHTRQTSLMLARKVAEGRLPEELMEVILEGLEASESEIESDDESDSESDIEAGGDGCIAQ